jgi:hypothetical protein
MGRVSSEGVGRRNADRTMRRCALPPEPAVTGPFSRRSASGPDHAIMSRMFRFLAVLVALAAAAPAPVLADGDHDRARRARAAGEIAGLDQLLARIAAEQPGRVIDVELERARGRYVYEVKLLTQIRDALKS